MSKSKSWHTSKWIRVLKDYKFWLMAVAISFCAARFRSELAKVSREPISSWSTSTTADCAVVLTGGPGRVREGFNLLSNHQVKKLIISGVNQSVYLHDIFSLWPFYSKVSENDVVLERRSETTFGNAVQSAPIVEALKCRDIALVTSRIHMHRAYETFRSSLPEGVQIHKHPVVSARLQPSLGEIFFEATKSFFYSTWVYF